VDDLLNLGLSNALAAALLALIALAAGMCCRRPALTHGLWLLVLLKLVTPPLVFIPVTWPTAAEPTRLDDTSVTQAPSPALEEDSLPPLPNEERSEVVVLSAVPVIEEPAALAPAAPDAVTPELVNEPPLWPRVLPIVWVLGSLGWFTLACWRLHRFRRLLKHVQPASAALQERARRLAGQLGLARFPTLGLLPGRLAPMLWAGGGAPRLLVPAKLLPLLDDEQLDTLLAHELAHLRRRDHWVRALEFVVLGLYWWHPIVWYARRELREAEEQCCDAWVVSTLPGAGRTYATALVDTLDFLSTAPPAVPLLASGLGQVSDLKRRLTMIMRGTTPRALSWPGCLVVLATGAFFLPLLPALQAQTPSKEEIKKERIRIVLDGDLKQVDLDKAKADLAAAEAALKAQMAQVEKAKAQLKAQMAKLEALRRDQLKATYGKDVDVIYRKVVISDDKAKKDVLFREVGKNPVIRIEIIASPDMKKDDLKDLLKKIESLVPQKRGRVILRVDSADPKVPVKLPPREYRKIPVVEKPVPDDLGYYPPAKAIVVKKPPQNAPADKRISELESKLEKVLLELQQLRKEMKRSRDENKP
jgi:beta-lactamase regulating signal transducer with metallopeptidase domain